VLSLLLVVASASLRFLADFQGNLLGLLGGQILVDAVIVPGVPFLAFWWRSRQGGNREQGALGLGLTLATLYTLLGAGEFIATDRQSDAWDLFLVPSLRVFQIVALMSLWNLVFSFQPKGHRRLAVLAVLGLCLCQPVLALLWYAGWGVFSTALVAFSWAGWMWSQYRAAPQEDGPEAITEEVPKALT
jgi:hypothetical protein